MTEKEDKKRKCWICGKQHPNVYEAFGCIVSHGDEEVGDNISGCGTKTKSIGQQEKAIPFQSTFRNTGVQSDIDNHSLPPKIWQNDDCNRVLKQSTRRNNL